jgi:multidrug resistance efflux pump
MAARGPRATPLSDLPNRGNSGWRERHNFGLNRRCQIMKAAGVLSAALVLSFSPSWADDIGGTGRIEPNGGVVVLNGVQGARVLSIPVHPDQMVKRGDLLMTLDDSEQRANTKIAEILLAEAKKDAAQSLVAAEETVSIDEGRLKRSVRDAENYRALGPEATSEKQIADMEQAANEARMQFELDEKKENQVLVDNAASIDSAVKRLQIEQQKLALYRMVAPTDGMVLRIDQHVGENLTGAPAIEMGDIHTMYVICQAFQGDLLKLRPGLRATIKSSAFSHPLKGTVENVGRLVDTKAQLGDVRIRLDNPAVASKVVGMEVEVEIAR